MYTVHILHKVYIVHMKGNKRISLHAAEKKSFLLLSDENTQRYSIEARMITQSTYTAKPTPLTKDAIRTKALQMADAEGIENLSIRKLAAALGKTPMALYRHYDSMDAIQQAVVALAYEEVDSQEMPGERWDDTIRRTTVSIFEMYKRHANAHLHLVESAAWDPALIAHTERIQRLHANQGIPPEVLMHAWRVIDAFLGGFIISCGIELKGEYHRPPADQPSWFETVERAYSDEAFRDGIDIIIAGIRALAAPDPCEWHTPME